MSNALTPPPAPNPQPQGQAQGSMPMPAGGPPQGAQQQAPAPTHQQTVAAIIHFGAIKKELLGIAADPDLGVADLKSKIIDGAAKLVGTGIVQPADAVTQLASVPERPFDQKQWVEAQLVQAIKAENAILDQHRAAFAGQEQAPGAAYSADNHQSIIAGLHDHYRGLKR